MLYDIYKVGQSQTNPWGIIDFPKETRLSQERTEQMMSADAYSGKSIIQKVLRLCCQNSQVGSYFVCAILYQTHISIVREKWSINWSRNVPLMVWANHPPTEWFGWKICQWRSPWFHLIGCDDSRVSYLEMDRDGLKALSEHEITWNSKDGVTY